MLNKQYGIAYQHDIQADDCGCQSTSRQQNWTIVYWQLMCTVLTDCTSRPQRATHWYHPSFFSHHSTSCELCQMLSGSIQLASRQQLATIVQIKHRSHGIQRLVLLQRMSVACLASLPRHLLTVTSSRTYIVCTVWGGEGITTAIKLYMVICTPTVTTVNFPHSVSLPYLLSITHADHCIAYTLPLPILSAIVCWQQPNCWCQDSCHMDGADCCLIGILGVMGKNISPDNSTMQYIRTLPSAQ